MAVAVLRRPATGGPCVPKLTSGRFNTWRVAMVLLTQLIFLGAPWLRWEGRPAVWLDLEGQRIFLFAWCFWPQDLVYLAGALIICALGLFWWTALAGRLWCGNSCPQTVYTEIMLWIEHWIEGDRPARLKLRADPYKPAHLARRAASQAVMIAVSLVIGFGLVAYFVPAPELLASVLDGSMGGWTLFWLLSYAGFTYLLAGRLREQVCLHMCPYARFQSVMFDSHTLLVGYDAKRGEPRGARRQQHTANPRGDCVDCGVCVQVCPTGIDIRNGLQYECIGCGACIDACDTVMDKLRAPRGLIRMTTPHAEASGQPARVTWLRPRPLIYLGLIGATALAMAVGLWQRAPLHVNVLRDRAVMVRETPEGLLENAYQIKVFNADSRPHIVQLSAEGLPGARVLTEPAQLLLPAHGQLQLLARVQAAPDNVQRGAQPLQLRITAQDDAAFSRREDTVFIGE